VNQLGKIPVLEIPDHPWKGTGMTELKIDYQLPEEVRLSLGNLVAEFTAAQAAKPAITVLIPAARRI
jgi:hypothetical protein